MRELSVHEKLDEILERLDNMERKHKIDATSNTCTRCGISFSGITGYYCQNINCPTFTKVSYSYSSAAPESYFNSIRAARDNMSSPGDKDYQD